ncbi:hypothetical protein DSO57_1036410 [Entomophthora muscae]|uniref:Uncharacterized protein n=1 Tax=Entomophthora muscae TaxID=34485 RepID=A0ACC2SC71_9FUNG|nr:hypothetical protein DSO57_1036410 [Entomophthora muscae]
MVHAQIDIWVIPLVFFLLPRATEAIYTCTFSILCQELALLPPANDDESKKTPPHTRANPPASDKDQVTLDSEEKERLRALGPCVCNMDFEPAQFNAFKQFFSGEVQGFHFHFCQAVACNVQAHAELSRLSWRDTLDTCRFVLAQFSALAFLKPEHTAMGFEVLSKNPYIVKHPEFKPFLK